MAKSGPLVGVTGGREGPKQVRGGFVVRQFGTALGAAVERSFVQSVTVKDLTVLSCVLRAAFMNSSMRASHCMWDRLEGLHEKTTRCGAEKGIEGIERCIATLLRTLR